MVNLVVDHRQLGHLLRLLEQGHLTFHRLLATGGIERAIKITGAVAGKQKPRESRGKLEQAWPRRDTIHPSSKRLIHCPYPSHEALFLATAETRRYKGMLMIARNALVSCGRHRLYHQKVFDMRVDWWLARKEFLGGFQ